MPPTEAMTDVLGEPFTAETIELPDDDEGAVVATLVRRAVGVPTGTGTRAVLHVHGFADYFFQADYATWWTERGYDFYALDLRKYGRSWLPHQTPTYVADLHEYDAELDAAWQRITERDGHDHVLVSAHSTGGLVAGLWADDRQPPALAGMVLNSPWTDLHGSALTRLLSSTVLKQIGLRQPRREIKRNVTGFYTRSLHRDHEGEWDFDLRWKPIESFTVYAGWLRAVRAGHASLHRGLAVPAPVLVLSSDRSTLPEAMDEDVHTTDIVLDVGQIRQWATAYGDHVTYVAVPGARHDVVLSREAPRERAYEVVGTWLDAWVEPR